MSKITSLCICSLLAHSRCSINVCPSDWAELNSSFNSHPALEGPSLRQNVSEQGTVRLRFRLQTIHSNFECFFSSVAQSCLTLCDPMNRSMPGPPVHHQLPEFTQTHVHWVADAIHTSHPLSSPSSPAPNPSQHQSLFQWVNSSHEVAKVLEFHL